MVCSPAILLDCFLVQEHPQKESYWGNVNPIGSRACYDEGKRVAETMCISYEKQVCKSLNSTACMALYSIIVAGRCTNQNCSNIQHFWPKNAHG